MSDLQDAEKSQHFVITELNNCVIIHSITKFVFILTVNHSLTAQGNNLPYFTHGGGGVIICRKAHFYINIIFRVAFFPEMKKNNVYY